MNNKAGLTFSEHVLKSALVTALKQSILECKVMFSNIVIEETGIPQITCDTYDKGGLLAYSFNLRSKELKNEFEQIILNSEFKELYVSLKSDSYISQYRVQLHILKRLISQNEEDMSSKLRDIIDRLYSQSQFNEDVIAYNEERKEKRKLYETKN